MKTIWDKKTGQPREVEAVDAREILANSPDLYTDDDPNAGKSKGKDPDGDGVEGAPQNVENVENEFRREPVGDNPPGQGRTETIIRNPVTDQPRMAPGGDADGVKSTPDFDEMTVPDLREYASENKIDLGDATKRADVLKKIQAAK